MSRKEPVWIDERDVLAVHDRLLALHGGLPGLRDRGLLESALARPRQHYSYADSVDILGMAALYRLALSGIVRSRTEINGRALWPAPCSELNSFDFLASEEDVIQAVFALAAGDLDEASYTAWLRSNAKRRRR